MNNNDLCEATRLWDRDLLRSESWLRSFDLWKIYVVGILNYKLIIVHRMRKYTLNNQLNFNLDYT
jgi:hypothetical protein